MVRGQELDDPGFPALQPALRPGRRRTRRRSTRHPEYPKITLLGINKFDADGKLRDEIYRRGAEGWHTDGAYDQAPFKATQLYALAVPSRGGDTLFASMYAAYDALPAAPEAAARRAASAPSPTAGARQGDGAAQPGGPDWTPVFHPIVRTHPETGRKALYFDPGKILRIDGLDEARATR